MKNIFVGNLSFNTGEDELRQIFEGYGQVDRVSIMTDRDTGRSRGFGFVEMASNEDGEKAITALNGSQVGGRTINVNEARPKTERAGGGGGGGGGGRDRGDRGGRWRWWRSPRSLLVPAASAVSSRSRTTFHIRISRGLINRRITIARLVLRGFDAPSARM